MMTAKQLAKYNKLTRRIARRLPVSAAETMWVWRMRSAYERMMKKAESE